VKHIALILIFALTACKTFEDVNNEIALEFRVGEQLMNDCNQRNTNCLEWLRFKQKWEDDTGHLITFEEGLRRHKARVAAGQAV
jgi:hypothetical protein